MLARLLLSAALLAPVASAQAAPARARATRAAAHREVLPFIADDYTRAVALAKARKVPLFVEAWAPW